MRLTTLIVFLSMMALVGCGDSETADADAVASRVAESVAATIDAQTTSPTSTIVSATLTSIPSPSRTAALTTITPSPTIAPATATVRPTFTPQPTATPRPARVDLTQYLPIGTDAAGPFTVIETETAPSTAFVYTTGFEQAMRRTMAKTSPEAFIIAACVEYNTAENARAATDAQYSAMMDGLEEFDLRAATAERIRAEHAFQSGGTTIVSEEVRPVSVVWFQIDRVMCYTVAVGVPGGDSPPHGFTVDTTNNVVDRIALANAPTPTPIPGGSDVYEIGQAVRFTDGFTITVLSVEDPIVANGEAVSPRASIVLVGVEIEACASSSTTGASINPLDIALALDNNSRADRSYGLVKQPTLDSGRLFPGECLQGWVTFERHWEPAPTYVIVDALGYSTFRVKAR